MVLVGRLKNRIAALNVCFDFSHAEAFQNGNEFFHRQRVVAPNVDASEKGDAGPHLTTVLEEN